MSKDDSHNDAAPYRIASEEPPRRRYRPMPGIRASSQCINDPYDKPALKRFLGTDPFPWALALCVVLWIAIGLIARLHPLLPFVLVAAGMLVCVLSQVWLYVSIFMEDREAGIWSLFSGWYRVFYLYMNPELAWRPTLLAAVGVLMMFTGLGMFLMRAK